tara:strand:+ start:1480 stop:2019 length:540 start_codon:yes stop_codon:yes gene_type:complete
MASSESTMIYFMLDLSESDMLNTRITLGGNMNNAEISSGLRMSSIFDAATVTGMEVIASPDIFVQRDSAPSSFATSIHMDGVNWRGAEVTDLSLTVSDCTIIADKQDASGAHGILISENEFTDASFIGSFLTINGDVTIHASNSNPSGVCAANGILVSGSDFTNSSFRGRRAMMLNITT